MAPRRSLRKSLAAEVSITQAPTQPATVFSDVPGERKGKKDEKKVKQSFARTHSKSLKKHQITLSIKLSRIKPVIMDGAAKKPLGSISSMHQFLE
jgi:hypothetical protein